MGRTLTPERQQLKQAALRIRQELGWSERKIAEHLNLNCVAVHRFLLHNSTSALLHNSPLKLNTVYITPCVEGMAKLPHDYVDLVFADPPYNIGVEYGNGNGGVTDKNAAYVEWCLLWFKQVFRVLKSGGAFYAMHYPQLCAQWFSKLEALGFTFQKWITWHYPTNIGQSPTNWTTSQRTILYFTKGKQPAYFDNLADPQPYRNPTDKRIKELIKNGNAGVTPYDTWIYNLVKNVSEDKTSWPNQIPVPLLERIVKTSCPAGGIVCDPFMGSGSTAQAAQKNGRQWIGFDLLEDSRKETEKRLERTNGSLQL